MSKLFLKVQQLLQETKIPLEDVAVATGVRFSTLARIRNPKYTNMPAVDTCEKIYEFLSGKQLEV